MYNAVDEYLIVLVFRFWVAVLRKFGGCAIVTNSCVNFIIYCLVGESFRKQFLSIFSLKCCSCLSTEDKSYSQEASFVNISTTTEVKMSQI